MTLTRAPTLLSQSTATSTSLEPLRVEIVHAPSEGSDEWGSLDPGGTARFFIFRWATRTVYSYDLATCEWTRSGRLPARRRSAAIASSGYGAVVFGGRGFFGWTSDAVMRGDARCEQWCVDGTLPSRLHSAGVATSDGDVWLAGGNDSNSWQPAVLAGKIGTELFVMRRNR